MKNILFFFVFVSFSLPAMAQTAEEGAEHAHAAPAADGVHDVAGACGGSGYMSDSCFDQAIDEVKKKTRERMENKGVGRYADYNVNLINNVHNQFHKNNKHQGGAGGDLVKLTQVDIDNFQVVMDKKVDLGVAAGKEIYVKDRAAELTKAIDAAYKNPDKLKEVATKYNLSSEKLEQIQKAGTEYISAMKTLEAGGEGAKQFHVLFHNVAMSPPSGPKDPSGGLIGLPSDAIRDHNHGMINASPNSPDPLLFDGKYSLSNGDPASALARARQAHNLDPNNADALSLRASANYQMGDYPGANKDARAALGLNPNDKTAFSVMKLTEGQTASPDLSQLSAQAQDGLAQAGLSPGASAKMTDAKALESMQLSREAERSLGLRDYDAAKEQAGRALDFNPNNPQALYARAMANNATRDYADALRDAVAGLKLAPGNPALLNAKAYALNRGKDYTGALEAADLAISADPKNAFAYANRAFALGGLGDRPGMLAALRRAAALDPRFESSLQSALQMPEGSDVAFLFPGETTASAQARPSRAFMGLGKNRFALLGAAALAGGALLAFGLVPMIKGGAGRRSRWTTSRGFRWQPSTGNGSQQEFAPSGVNSQALGLLAGQYEIGRQIGMGGMGMVFAGKDASLERPVAIKKMRPELAADRRERERFLTEARACAALHHPNIVDIYSILEQSHDLYLVFEYVEGKNLNDILAESGRISLREAKAYLRGAGEALQYAHKKGVIHRDLKPSNIMIDKEGVPKVMDFGIARVAHEAMTRMSNTVIGTPPYMAPEQEEKGQSSRQSDVYSLAVCLYECLSGRLPFEGSGAGMLINKMKMDYRPITELVPSLPKELDDLFKYALAADPAKRMADAREFAAALDALPAEVRG